jgi:hypothetical protein
MIERKNGKTLYRSGYILYHISIVLLLTFVNCMWWKETKSYGGWKEQGKKKKEKVMNVGIFFQSLCWNNIQYNSIKRYAFRHSTHDQD